MSEHRIAQSPPRLLGDSRAHSSVARLLAGSERCLPEPGDENRPWRALKAALGAPQRRPRAWLLAPALAGCVAVALALFFTRDQGSRAGSNPSVPATVARVMGIGGQVALGDGERVTLGDRLRAGDRLTTAADSLVELATSTGMAVVVAEKSDIELGGIDDRADLIVRAGSISVRPTSDRAEGVTTNVQIAAYRVAFGAATVEIATSLSGEAGELRVQVHRGAANVDSVDSPADDPIRIPAGTCWSSRTGIIGTCSQAPQEPQEPQMTAIQPVARPADTIANEPVEKPPKKPDPKRSATRKRPAASVRTLPDARARATRLVAEGRPDEAITALAGAAAGRGARAEFAQYEIARIRHRQLGRLADAANDYRTYLRRFPDGRLGQEAELNIIEIELKRGRHKPALAAIDRFLAEHADSERVADLRLQKGHVLRARADFSAAVSVYDRAAQTAIRARIADEATYYAAWCQSERGQTDDARARLRAYLKRFPDGRHAAAARKSLAED